MSNRKINLFSILPNYKNWLWANARKNTGRAPGYPQTQLKPFSFSQKKVAEGQMRPAVPIHYIKIFMSYIKSYFKNGALRGICSYPFCAAALQVSTVMSNKHQINKPKNNIKKSYIIHHISCIFLFSLLFSCGVQKHIPKGDTLFNGSNVTVKRDSGVKESPKSLASTLKGLTVPKKNAMILGWAYKVGFWYAIGEPKRNTGLKHWLREKFGEPPVLGSNVNIKKNTDNIEGYLENNGYFKSTAMGDTTVKGFKSKANYQVHVTQPYTIKSVQWHLDTSILKRDLLSGKNKKTFIKPNQQYNLDNIKAERERYDLKLKNKGYYFFNSDDIIASLDSSNHNHTLDVYLQLKTITPEKAKHPHTMSTIVVFPNYTLLYPAPDTSLKNLKSVDHIYIRDTVNEYKASVFTRAITYRPGEKYSLKQQNTTLNRLINLGSFKFVKNRFESDGHNDSLWKLKVFYYLTPQKKQTLQTEVSGFTKSNSFTGGQLGVNYKNRNYLHGAETFGVRTYGAFETSSNDTLKSNNNFRLGTEVSLTFPRFVTPFHVKENDLFPPRTRVLLGYEWLRRSGLYTKNSFHFQYELDWKSNLNTEQTLAPVSISYNTTAGVTPLYEAQLTSIPSLRVTIQPEIILGSFYNFTTSTTRANASNIWYFNFNAEAAGNIVGAFKSNKQPYTGQVFGAYYSQYGKVDMELRYSRKLKPKSDLYLANRLMIGIGLPYNNSSYLPFSKQYIIGGSSSLRGFSPRTLGPGITQASAEKQLYYPQVGGDYKLEANTELRFPIFSRLKGALFVDAGNIWTKDTTLYGTGSMLTKDFLKQVAVDAGFGLRIDVTLFVLRLDIATPLRVPYLPEGERWKKNFGFRDLVFNIGIGYPF